MAKGLKNHGSDWTAADMKQLKQLAKGNTARIAALKLGRTPGAVQQKASVEGISFGSSNQRPYGKNKR